jgi:hypothetical protein
MPRCDAPSAPLAALKNSAKSCPCVAPAMWQSWPLVPAKPRFLLELPIVVVSVQLGMLQLPPRVPLLFRCFAALISVMLDCTFRSFVWTSSLLLIDSHVQKCRKHPRGSRALLHLVDFAHHNPCPCHRFPVPLVAPRNDLQQDGFLWSCCSCKKDVSRRCFVSPKISEAK